PTPATKLAVYVHRASVGGIWCPMKKPSPKKKTKSKPSQPFDIRSWMDESRPDSAAKELVLLQERAGARAMVEAAFRETVKDHLAGLSIIHRISGYEKSLEYIRNKMPRPIRVHFTLNSGGFGNRLSAGDLRGPTGSIPLPAPPPPPLSIRPAVHTAH